MQTNKLSIIYSQDEVEFEENIELKNFLIPPSLVADPADDSECCVSSVVEVGVDGERGSSENALNKRIMMFEKKNRLLFG